MRTEYSVTFLQNILNAYSKIGTIHEYHLFTSGFENSNFYVRTEVGEFVIKIFEGEHVDERHVAFELAAMETSYAAGGKTPRVYRTTKDALYCMSDAKIGMVMEYVDGVNMDGQAFSDSLVYELGIELAHMDNALSVFTDGSYTRQHYEFDLKTILESRQHLSIVPAHLDNSIYVEVLEQFNKNKPAFDTLPTGLIHNDAASHNIIVRDNHIACIIDFSDMAFSPYIQNIAVCIAQTVLGANWNPAQIKIFIQGYTSRRTVSAQELSLLYHLVRARYVQVVLAFCDWNNRLGYDADRAKYITQTDTYLRTITAMGEHNFNSFLPNL